MFQAIAEELRERRHITSIGIVKVAHRFIAEEQCKHGTYLLYLYGDTVLSSSFAKAIAQFRRNGFHALEDGRVTLQNGQRSKTSRHSDGVTA